MILLNKILKIYFYYTNLCEKRPPASAYLHLIRIKLKHCNHVTDKEKDVLPFDTNA